MIILSAMGTAAKITLNPDPGRGSMVQLVPTLPTNPSTPAPAEKPLSAGSSSGERDVKDRHLYVDISLANQVQQKALASMDV